MKNFKNHIFLKLIFFSLISLAVLSCSHENEEVYDQELVSFEEFVTGPKEIQGSMEDLEESFGPPEGYNSKDQSEILVMETIDGKNTYYISNNGNDYTKISNQKAADFKNDKFWAATIYNGTDLYGSGSLSYYLSNTATRKWTTFNFPLHLNDRVRSIVAKGNMSLMIHEDYHLEGKGHYRNGKDKNSVAYRTLNRSNYSSIAFYPYDSKDARVALYEDWDFLGQVRPIWDKPTIGDTWKNRASSLRVNGRDWTEGIVCVGSNGESGVASADIPRLPPELQDKIIDILLGKIRGKRCSPRLACFRGAACNGATVSNAGSLLKCNRALRNLGVSSNRRSFCSMTGHCINPYNYQGVSD